MTQPPDWAVAVPSTPAVHPSGTQNTEFTRPFTQAQLIEIGAQLIEQLLQKVLLALVGVFIPGSSSFSQLQSWANNVPLIGPLLAALTGSSTTGGGGLGGLGAWSTDLKGILGNPTGLGSGAPVLPGIGSIPLLGGLFGGGGTLLTSLIPGLPASIITSGTFPLSIVSGLLGLFGGATNSTQAANYNTNLLSLLNNPTLTGSPGSFSPSTVLTGWITGQINPLGAITVPGTGITSGVPDATVPGIGTMLDNFFNGITGLSGSAWGQSATAGAVVGQTDTITSNSGMLAQILAGMGSGNTDSDAFERVSATDLGANWDIYKSNAGVLATPNGHDAAFSGSTTTDIIARKNNISAATDNQSATIVLATAAASLPPFISTNFGYNDIWLRMSGFTTFATASGVRLRIKANGALTLSAFVSGTETVLTTGSTSAPAGSIFAFNAGVSGVSRRFTVTKNGATIMDFTEAGTTSQLGAGFRKRGFGGRIEQLVVAVLPGALKQWTATG